MLEPCRDMPIEMCSGPTQISSYTVNTFSIIFRCELSAHHLLILDRYSVLYVFAPIQKKQEENMKKKEVRQ
jgi:hypothetical protein